MEIGRKLRELREKKHLSQGHIELKTGLLRCYVSRVENGFTVPSVETLEKFARALEVPLYRLFTEAKRVKIPNFPASKTESGWEVNGDHRREIRQFDQAFSQMDVRKQTLLLHLAQEMARRHNPPRRIKSEDQKRK